MSFLEVRGARIAFLVLAFMVGLTAGAAWAGGPTNFHTISMPPCRLFDSRTPADSPALQGGVERLIQVTGKCGVPADARSIAFNVTVTQGTSDGKLFLYPGDATTPAAGELNFKQNRTRARVSIVELASDVSGTIKALADMPSGQSVHLILDINGYFMDSAQAVNDVATVNEDSGATAIDVRANDNGPPGGGPFSIGSVTQPANGTVALTPAGPGPYTGLTYTPDPNYCNDGTPTDNFTYTLTPGMSTATVAVTVTCVPDAPVVTTTPGTTSFTEGGGAVVVDSGVTVTDPDSPNLASATVTITNPQDGASEVLAATSCAGLTVTPGLNSLSITGSQPPATYQTCLQSVTYDNTSLNPDTTARVISFVANDGTLSSAAANKTVTVAATANAPVVTTTGGTTPFTEGDGAVVVDSGVTVTDADSANLASATVTITNPQDGASEVLGATSCAGLTVTPGLNSLSITGSQPPATYQTCLQSVTYNNTSQDPNTTARVISFVANDGTSSSAAATKTVTMTAVPNAPVVTTTGGTTSFTEDGGAVVVDTGVTVTDIDSANLASATVTITNPQDGASEVLAATSCAGLTVTPGLNSLSITGSQPPATYQTCLQSVTYNNTSQDPNTTARVISFVANDGSLSSSAATKTVTVASVPDAPVVTTTGGTTSFTEDGGAVVVDSGVTVTDADSANLASATVTITNPQDGASEVLGATSCAGLTVTPGLNSLSITGSQPPATYQTCLQSVTYNNSSQNPGTTARVISFVANDGTVSSAAATKTVTVASVPDAPVVTTTGGTTSFTEDGGAVVVDSLVTVTDADSANLASATVTITNPQDGAAEVLAATSCVGLTVTPGLNSLSITGSQPPATYQTCLRSVTYNNSSQDPNTTARVISFVANDGSLSSSAATKTVTVASVPDAPVVTTTGGTTSFTEDGGAVVVDSLVTVTDGDSANLASATVTITNPQDGASEVLAATSCVGLTVTPGLNSLSITGSQPPATYQTCLQSVTYNNSSQNPGTTARVISFVANDGSLSSTAATKTVTVTSVPDAPVVTTTGGTTSFTEDGGAVVVDSGVTVTDADSANLASATVTITNPQDGASEVLAATSCAGLTVTPGLNTLSITGSQPPATYQTCLQSVTYNNSSQNPGTTTRVISFVANDGSVSSVAATKSVSVTAVPDPPVPTTNPITYSTAGNTQLHVKGKLLPGVVAIADSQGIVEKAGPFIDPDGPAPATIVDASGTSAQGGSYDIDADGSFTYVPPAGFTGSDTFNYQVTDTLVTASYPVNITVGTRVWYIRDVIDANNPSSADDGRSTNPFDSIAEFNAATTNDNDVIFVFRGNTGTTPLSGGITLRNGQKLHGEGIGLTVSPFGTLVAAGSKPRISNGSGDAVSVPATAGNRQNVEIRGLDLSGSVNAIDVTASGANLVGATISDNDITAAGAEGIDLNAGSTGAFTATLSNNAIAATGNGFDARTSANTAMTINFSNNAAASTATAILIDGSVGGGTTTITGFANNAVSGNTGGTGISITSAKFDATPGGTFQTVSGGSTVVGASGVGNGAGASGVVMTNVSGDLSFTDLDIFADAGAGLRASGTTAYTGTAGFQIAVGSGVATVSAVGGPAVDLTTVTASLPFQQITSTNSSTTGVALNSLLGTFSAASGSSITGSSGTGFQVGSSNATITYNGTVTTTAGKGVDLTSNTGSTISFTGTLTLSSGTNTAFNATGGGTVTATDTASTLTSTTGTALNVANTTIGAAGLKFRSISANGAANGIVLNNTGSSGGLTVLGNGGSCTIATPTCTGGTIQSSTGAGISLTSTTGPSLSLMRVTAGGDDGILGSSVNGFTLANSLVTNNGNALNENGVEFSGLTGTASITSSVISGSFNNNATIRNSSGTLTLLTVTGSTFSSNVSTSDGDGLLFEASGTANMSINLSGSTFSSHQGDHFQAAALNSGVLNVVFSGNTLSGGHAAPLGQGITINAATGVPGYSGSVTYDIDGNTINGAISNAIMVNLGTSASGSAFAGQIRNNVIGTSGSALSCSTQANGINVEAHGNGTHTVSITGNTIRRCFDRGINVLANDGNGVLNVTSTNNTVTEMSDTNGVTGTPREAFILQAGSTTTNVFGQIDSHGVCLSLSGPSGSLVGGTFKNGDIRVRQRFRTSVRLPGYGGTPFDTAAVVTFLQGNNPGSTATATSNDDAGVTTDGYFGGAACPLP